MLVKKSIISPVLCSAKPLSWCLMTLLMCTSSVANEVNMQSALTIDNSFYQKQANGESSAHRGLLELSLEKNAGDWQLFANALMFRGDNGSEDVGALQSFSNIDDDPFAKIHSVWAEYQFERQQSSLQLGWLDLNERFAYADNASDFINAAMGLSPTHLALPTYPNPHFSVVYKHNISANKQWSLAVSAGEHSTDFSSRFYISQWQQQVNDIIFRSGIWHHDGRFISLANDQAVSNVSGFFALLDGEADNSLKYFLKYGYSNKNVAEVQHHLDFGFSVRASAINADLWGVAFSTAWLNKHLASEKNKEMTVEMFVAFTINETFSVKPDLQYIIFPAGEDRRELVFTLRSEINF